MEGSAVVVQGEVQCKIRSVLDVIQSDRMKSVPCELHPNVMDHQAWTASRMEPHLLLVQLPPKLQYHKLFVINNHG
jgi:hypothetical protein